MPIHPGSDVAVKARRHTALFPHSIRSTLTLLVAALLQGCTAAPSSPFAGPDPANPQAKVATLRHGSPLGRYVGQRPVEPLPWQQQNQRVAPASKE